MRFGSLVICCRLRVEEDGFGVGRTEVLAFWLGCAWVAAGWASFPCRFTSSSTRRPGWCLQLPAQRFVTDVCGVTGEGCQRLVLREELQLSP